MLTENRFDTDDLMTGLEVELNLVDDAGDSALKNAEVLEAIAALEQTGQLQRQCGRVQSVQLVDDALQLTLDHAGATRTLQADLVIQTVGLNTDVRRTQHRLVRQLQTNAHSTADPLGLGAQADGTGRLRHDGSSWPHLFAIGSLGRGTLWESTAMPEIRQQARHLADRLLDGQELRPPQ